jgi:glutamate/tyrosine decarboxylase-like PLP-dependent enzyme
VTRRRDPLQLERTERARLFTRLFGLIESELERPADASAGAPPNAQKVLAMLARLDPAAPVDAIRALEEVARALDRHGVHPTHPRYFGHFNPAPAALGVAAEALAAAFNPQLATHSHSPAAVGIERAVVRWIGARFGYAPEDADGAVTSGGAEANLTALLMALVDRFPTWGEDGLVGVARRPLVYLTEATHPTVTRAARVCGLGRASLRSVRCDAAGRLDPHELARTVRADRAAGGEPLAVVSTVGTTASGAVDPVRAVGEVAAAERLWHHVDAAWGGLAAFVPALADLIDGCAEADSIAFDPHKALSAPMGAGLLLTRRGALLDRAFAAEAGYMPQRGGDPDPYARGLPWSRRFAGLKVFLPLVVAGWDGVREALETQVALGDRLRARLRERGWQVVNDTRLPLVCFVRPGASDEALRRIAASVRADGKAWIAVSRDGGRAALRACITSHRTREADVDALVDLLDQAC